MVFFPALSMALSAAVAAHAYTENAPPQLLSEAPYVLALTEKVARPASKTAALRNINRRSRQAFPDIAGVEGALQDKEYLVNITVGGQTFKVVIDTGSSDTWIVQQNFTCHSIYGNPESQAFCKFGSQGFDPTASDTFEQYAGHNFNISYLDGESLVGTVGFDTVEVGGLSVPHQEIGVATSAIWRGDGVSSGLLGLCYPALTHVYTGTDSSADSVSDKELYSPFFFNAVEQGLLPQPVFSVALNRGSFQAEQNSTEDPNLGYIALGGIVPVPTTGTEVTVPIQTTQLSSNETGYRFYTVDVEYTFPGSENLTTEGTSVLDTGTTLLYLPTAVANALAAAFDPPAVYRDVDYGYYVHCNATVPDFSVVVGGVSFPIAAEDLIMPVGTQYCIGSWQDGGNESSGFILGDVFFHNVVATFDVQSNHVTLSQRAPY